MISWEERLRHIVAIVDKDRRLPLWIWLTTFLIATLGFLFFLGPALNSARYYSQFSWRWYDSSLRLYYAISAGLTSLILGLTFARVHYGEVHRGTIRSIILYPVDMNDIAIAKLLSSLIVAAALSTMLFLGAEDGEEQHRRQGRRNDEAREELRDRDVVHVDRIEDDRPDRAAVDLAVMDAGEGEAEDQGREAGRDRIVQAQGGVVPSPGELGIIARGAQGRPKEEEETQGGDEERRQPDPQREPAVLVDDGDDVAEAFFPGDHRVSPCGGCGVGNVSRE